jgi:hypothetical protein
MASGGAALRLRTRPNLDSASDPSSHSHSWLLEGWSMAGDASHPTACHDVETGIRMLTELWQQAPHPSALISHGTGTQAGDAYENAVLAGGPWKDLPRIDCKPTIGHCLGASGLVELALGLSSDLPSFWKVAFGFGGHLAGVAMRLSASQEPGINE